MPLTIGLACNIGHEFSRSTLKIALSKYQCNPTQMIKYVKDSLYDCNNTVNTVFKKKSTINESENSKQILEQVEYYQYSLIRLSRL